MNNGGFETGMLSLVPWLLESAKVYAKQKKMSDIESICEQLKSAFGESVSVISVSQCLGAILTINRKLYNELK